MLIFVVGLPTNAKEAHTKQFRENDHGDDHPQEETTPLASLFANHSPESAQLQAAGFGLEPSRRWFERRLTYRITGPYLTPEMLTHEWRYSLGDSDLA